MDKRKLGKPYTKEESQKIVDEFMEAVYPGNAELMKVSFSEIHALKTATEIINDLRKQTKTGDSE